MKKHITQKILSGALWCVVTWASAAPFTWYPGPTLPDARSFAASCAVVSNWIYSNPLQPGMIFVGGGNAAANPTSVLVMTPGALTPAWSSGIVPLDSTLIGAGCAPLESGQILVFGGEAGDLLSLPNAETLDASADGSLYPASPMSIGRSFAGYAQDTPGTNYVFGGLDASGNILDSAEKFANTYSIPAASVWVSIASMPTARFGVAAAFDNIGAIYTFGGGVVNDSVSVSANVYRYTISTDSWSEMAPMPIPTRDAAAARAVNGKIYVFGGLSAAGVIANVQVYDTVSNAWTVETALPSPVRGAAAVYDAATASLYVIGGEDANGMMYANVWHTQNLTTADVAPSIFSTPVTQAYAGTAYTYDVNSSGSPPPTYALSMAPAGMTIDYYSGVISWLPSAAQAGTQNATVVATNALGASTQSFTINVAGAPKDTTPPTTPTGLTATNITQTTAQLNWVASTDNVGVVGYSVYRRKKCGAKGTTYCETLVGSPTTNSFALTGLTHGTYYTYGVKAKDAAGNVSGEVYVNFYTL